MLGVSSALLAAALAHHAIRPLTWEYGGPGGALARASCPDQHYVAGARVFRGETTIAGVTLLCRSEHAHAWVDGDTLGTRTSTSETIECERGWSSVGIWGFAGGLVDRFSLICAPRTDPAGPVTYLVGVGGTGGRGFHTRCAGGLRGLRGGAGELLDRVGLICGENGDE